MKRQHQVPRPERPAEETVGFDDGKRVDFSGEAEARPPSADPGSHCAESQMIASGNDFAALVAALNAQTRAIGTLVATLAPELPDLVGTDYIARRLGCTPQWVGAMAERGDIPKHCIAPKVSGGRIWKFRRDKIDAWLREREES